MVAFPKNKDSEKEGKLPSCKKVRGEILKAFEAELKELVRNLLESLMREERELYLEPHPTKANGYYTRDLLTLAGPVEALKHLPSPGVVSFRVCNLLFQQKLHEVPNVCLKPRGKLFNQLLQGRHGSPFFLSRPRPSKLGGKALSSARSRYPKPAGSAGSRPFPPPE